MSSYKLSKCVTFWGKYFFLNNFAKLSFIEQNERLFSYIFPNWQYLWSATRSANLDLKLLKDHCENNSMQKKSIMAQPIGVMTDILNSKSFRNVTTRLKKLYGNMSWKSDDLACCSSGEQYHSQSEIRAVELCRKVSLTL